MTLLVLGQTGQVATELRRLAPDARYLGRAEADFTDPEACAAAVRGAAPDGIIIAAAWTAVDAAEDNRAAAFAVNATTPGRIAEVAAELSVPLVHISTDYVFDGTGDVPRKPSDPVAPLGVYGASKLAGERAVAAAGGTYAILRTSWVFSAHGANFVKTMLRLSETRDALNVVADQIGGPTPASDIAKASLAMVAALSTAPEKSGIYHLAGAPDVSWADFARAIFARAGREVQVNDIPTEDYPTPAERPRNSRLDGTTLSETFGIPKPDWARGLDSVLKELGVAR
jgi:dTDP-4-dehydrorhamnose reductase